MFIRTCIVILCSICVATSAIADMRMDVSCLAAPIERPGGIEKAVEERQLYGIQENGIFIPLPEHLRDGASPELNARSVIWDLETIAQRRGTQQQIIAALGRINREYRDYSENDLTRIRALLEGLKSFGKNNEGYEWVRSYAAQLWDEIDFLLLTRANKKNRHYRWNVLLIYKSN